MPSKKHRNMALWFFMVLGAIPVIALLCLFLVQEHQETDASTDFNLDEVHRKEALLPEVIKKINDPDPETTLESPTWLEPVENKESLSRLYQGIQARVIDAFSGKPMTKYTLYYCEESEGDITVKAQTKSRIVRSQKDGIVRLFGLEEGTYSIAIEAAGYPPFYRNGLKVPQKEPLLSLALARGNFIEGKVINSRAQTVEGMSVHLRVEKLDQPTDTPPSRRISRTNRMGVFLFGGLPPGRYGLALNSLQHPLAEVKDLYLAPGGSLYPVLNLPDLTTVEFHITEPSGRSIPNARIRFHEKNGKYTFAQKTDMYGKAKCNNVPAGEFSLRIFKNTYTTINEGNFKILPGSDIIRVDRTLTKTR
jgi:hypothetical protein